MSDGHFPASAKGYGRSTGYKLGGSKSRGPGLNLKSDLKLAHAKSKAKHQARKKV